MGKSKGKKRNEYVKPTEPNRFLTKLAQQLLESRKEQEEFIEAILSPRDYPSMVLWTRERDPAFPFEVMQPLPWQPSFADRVAIGSRAGAHELHEQGAYYCLDPSSVFAGQVLSAINEPINSVLDLCAAPGGKCTMSWIYFRPEVLLANENIGKRLGALVSNIKRCKIAPVSVLNFDPSVLSQRIQNCLDLVVVDAPCSGQSLLVKGLTSAGCFHPSSVNLNLNRQRRILSHAAQVVRGGGYLAYMTCTFAPEENEEMLEWFLKKQPTFSVVEVPILDAHRSHLSEYPCYRLWPQQGVGAGSFTVLLKKSESEPREEIDFTKIPPSWSPENSKG